MTTSEPSEAYAVTFHYALADAFTICDAYHCSLLGPTDPNRYYMWTGWVGNDGSGGGPVIDNAELGYSWSTYPELLQNAGITWKVYQIGNRNRPRCFRGLFCGKVTRFSEKDLDISQKRSNRSVAGIE
jgi:phospholipase C